MLDGIEEEAESLADKLEEEDSEFITKNDDGSITVHLVETVAYRHGREDKEVGEVLFRRATGRDWMDTDKAKGQMGKVVQLASSMSGLPVSVFAKMDGDDFLRCTRVVNAFGKKSPATGGKS